MGERISAATLLYEAALLYDDPVTGLAHSSGRAWQGGFGSGGWWMRQALEHLRRAPLPGTVRDLNTLGVIKYGIACLACLLCASVILWLQQPALLLLSVLAFYAVEAQMVFLFPVALEGNPQPFGEARRKMSEAGGTLVVMGVVLPVAATMLLGGFVGRGFVRSWCLGCLAVCIWYEAVRTRARAS